MSIRSRHERFGSKSRKRRLTPHDREQQRRLSLEKLEDRQLLAVGPQLRGAQPNNSDLFSFTNPDANVRSVSPRELALRFDENQRLDATTLGAIQILRAGADGIFGNANDVRITPGYIGVSASPNENEVIIRFAETLPDDLYRVEIFGVGSASPLRNLNGQAFVPTLADADGDSTRDTIRFELDLGPQVIAVVPQPVSRNLSGSLVQARDVIDVYFNNDDLFLESDDLGRPTRASAENPAFYQLIFTNESVRNTDDVVILPTTVNYDPVNDMARLTFAQPLDALLNPDTGALIGPGTFRLRIGTDEAAPLAPQAISPSLNISSDFNTNDEVVLQFSAARPSEKQLGIVVDRRDLGTGIAAPKVLVNVVESLIYLTLNSRAGNEATAADVVDAVNRDAVARQIVVASINQGNPTTKVGDRAVNYSPLQLSGLGSSFLTASDLTDNTDVGPTLVVTGAGVAFLDGQFFEITDTSGVKRKFEFDRDVPTALNDPVSIPVSFTVNTTPAAIVTTLVNAINGASFGTRAFQAGNQIVFEGDRFIDLGAGVSGLTKQYQDRFDAGLKLEITRAGDSFSDGQTFTLTDTLGVPRVFELEEGLYLDVPADLAATIADGQTFAITDRLANTVTFEFEDVIIGDGVTDAAHIAVPYDSATAVQQDVVNAVIAAIQSQLTAGTLVDLATRDFGNGRIHLGSSLQAVDLQTSGLTQSSTLGATTADAVLVPFVRTRSFTSNDLARAVADAINGAGFATKAVATSSSVRLENEKFVDLALPGLQVGFEGRFDAGPVLVVTKPGSGFADGETIAIQDDRGQVQILEFDADQFLQLPAAGGVVINNGDTFMITHRTGPGAAPATLLTFEFDRESDGVVGSNIAIPYTIGSNQQQLLNAVMTAIEGQITAGKLTGVTLRDAGAGRLQLGLSPAYSFQVAGTPALVLLGPTLNDPTALAVTRVGTESPAVMAARIADAVNFANFRASATAVAERIYLTNDHQVDLDRTLTAVSKASQGVIISSSIDPQPFAFDFPGANDEPGHRDIPEEVGTSIEQHINSAFGQLGRDVKPGVTTIFYNFRSDYGQDPQGVTLENAITEQQRQRAREAFQLWGKYLGVHFLESAREGITIATGDLTALNTNATDVLSFASNGFRVRIDPRFANALLVMDSRLQWLEDFGETWFLNSMVGIGAMLGLELANDLPTSNLMARFTAPTDPITGKRSPFLNVGDAEPIFPGNADILHGQHLYRPDGVDVDLYRFEISLDEGRTGLFTAETFSERLPNASLLNTVLRLYRENADGTRVLLAQNDDYFSRDSFIELNLSSGVYYIGVSASGNVNYDPTIEDTGLGGTTQGAYDLRLNFRSQVEDENTLRDLDGIQNAIDGDADGTSGGVYNFWFQTRSLNRVLDVTADGASYRDGQILSITNNTGVIRRFEFDNNGVITPGNTAIPFSASPATTAANLASALAAAITNAGFGVTATNPAGTARLVLTGERALSLSSNFVGIGIQGKTIFVDKSAGPSADGSLARPFNNIASTTVANAFAATHPGDIVRIVGNGGTDGNLATVGDNFAYEIGFGTQGGQLLEDGTDMAVPKGTTVMIDPGAIFKMRRSRVGVGSTSLTVDRSGGALQVLGTPKNNVVFTSWLDETIGKDNFAPSTTPARGDWGGLMFLADVDNAESRRNLEDEGIFINYVNHADIRYGGGGGVVIDSIQQIVNPIQMNQMRPTISFNSITQSADSAMSASPNSFDETNFHAPLYQSGGAFTSDYSRIGPDIHSNRLINNSTNGLFIRIETPVANALQSLTVSGRFDDTDIVHVLAENLVIQGSDGPALLDLQRPAVDLITFAPRSGGGLPAGTYRYKVTFVDENGFEGRPSVATSSYTISSTASTSGIGSIQLNQLPPVTSGFVRRRVYRTDGNSDGVYRLVAELNASDTVLIDTIAPSNLRDLLRRDPPSAVGVTLTPQARGSLAAGTYNYRVVFVDAAGNEGASSDPTVAVSITGVGTQGGIRLDNLPPANGSFIARRLYRSTVGGISPYELVVELDATSTSYTDDGYSVGDELDASAFGVVRARPQARLTIDPGTVVKMEGARIELRFGAQLIAEGVVGQEVIFTSRQDDKYGAGGTFDTNDDDRQGVNETQPAPGDWGGLVFGPLSRGSIDHAVIGYGGGINRIEGTFTGFNVIEVQQAELRLTNSLIRDNAEGVGGQGPLDRFGRGYNRPATIFVRGAQPIIVNNIFQDNNTQYDSTKSAARLQMPAITINANSLIHNPFVDYGRSTGLNDRITSYADNAGPLIRGNQLTNNAINGLVVRGEVLTTASVWDDTDIVHVLTNQFNQRDTLTTDASGNRRTFAYDEVVVPEHHTYGGLRLQSSPNESLVIKLLGAGNNDNHVNLNQNQVFEGTIHANAYEGAGFTVGGQLFETADRIGGSLHVVGQPGFPVVLTSLHDDSVGAGVQPSGQPQTDTNNNGIATIPRPNDWRSLRFDQNSNDRNVEIVLENEPADATAPGLNATTNTAQVLGFLAANEQSGDENLRMGFQVQGFINEPNDVDVYSFSGVAGTEVWFDIDRTTFTLDTIVELLDANGNVLARSNDSVNEFDQVEYVSDQISESRVGPLRKSPAPYFPKHASGLPRDFYSLNPRDAGLRVALTGVSGARGTYHVRVRSADGLTTGVYQFQVRMKELDEFPGSTVRFASISYANNGIQLVGLPAHSPLLGESAEDESVGSFAINDQLDPDPVFPYIQPQFIGNLLSTDRAAISVAGTTETAGDIDFYNFNVDYLAINRNSPNQHYAVTFDIDYADAVVRYNSSMYVFDSLGRLVLVGRDSNLAEDRGGPLQGSDLDDLSRGSVGPLDPFIGPVLLPESSYYVAVSSNARVPDELISNPLVRLEPINSVIRIAEDHINSTLRSTAEPPVVPFLLDTTFAGTGTNLWQVTNNRAADPGHGLTATFDRSRSATNGGQSFYFGSPAAGNTVPVGSVGTLESQRFSLRGYSSADLPTLYFNYFLENNEVLDRFRVWVVDADDRVGPTDLGTLVASSNVFDTFGGNARLIPQSNGDWRQLRLSLGAFAGRDNLQLIFEYVEGSGTGTFEGAYVDDLIIGFAERGEMVTNATVNSSFVGNPDSTLGQILSGDYQLELREATHFGTSVNSGFGVGLTLNRSIDTNDRLAQTTTLLAPAGSEVIDGQTFVISDGVNEVTFEYENAEVGNGVTAGNVEIRYRTFNTATASWQNDADYVIARRIRDAINSAQVQTILNVRAAMSDGEVTGTTSTDRRVNLFGGALVAQPQPFAITGVSSGANSLRDALLGAGMTTVGNARFVGSDVSAGTFSGGLELLGLDSGIVLTTGDARLASRANSADSSTGRASQMGDADLEAALGIPAGSSRDTTSLEFDFQLNGGLGGELFLNFLFASEEYNERVGSAFADGVAILIDRDITDGISYENIALVPGTTPSQTVSINTVNRTTNANLFTNNDPSDSGLFLDQFAYDGFTQAFQASLTGAAALGAGTHRIKIVISDRGDLGGDSAVFLEAKSLANAPLVRLPEGIESVRHTGVGDENRFRDQGQVLIHSNTIAQSKNFAVVADAGRRNGDGTLASIRPDYRGDGGPLRVPVVLQSPNPGPVRNLVVDNNTPEAGGFAPGVIVSNNTIYSDGGIGGVHVSGDGRTFELGVRRPWSGATSNNSAGDSVCDGDWFTIVAFGETLTFEFEDVAGSPADDQARACRVGSGSGGGNGYVEGRVPIYFRRSIPTQGGYSQREMAEAIENAIDGSRFVSNDSTLVLNTYIGPSRAAGGVNIRDGGVEGTPGNDFSVYVENVTTIFGNTSNENFFNSKGLNTIRALSHDIPAQPFSRVVNNTIVGNDGNYSSFPDPNVEPNDTLFKAMDTRQGKQHNPQAYNTTATIGDTLNFLTDTSVDVDFYKFQLEIGDTVDIDINPGVGGSGLSPVMRLFNSVGEQLLIQNSQAGQRLRSFYTATVGGAYYIGISGAGNSTYSPQSLSNRSGGASTGNYSLALNVRAPRTYVIEAQNGSALSGTITLDLEDVNGQIRTVNVGVGGGDRDHQVARNLAAAITGAGAGTNVQNLANGRFGVANPLAPISAEAYGAQAHILHSISQPSAAPQFERFVVIRNAARVTSRGIGVRITPTTDNDLDQIVAERGILVTNQATPTLMNNVLANLHIGVEQTLFQANSPGPVDVGRAVPGGMIEGASLYYANNPNPRSRSRAGLPANSNLPNSGQDFQIVLPGSEPLFVNAANQNFYPAAGSLVIDSSIDTLPERRDFESTKQAIGIALSPILSPDRDVTGQLRVDDPNVNTPSGLGANVFKDRGSLDRSDFVGPAAVLVLPQDNDAKGLDTDGAPSFIQIDDAARVFANFTLQFVDGFEAADPFPGVGVDDTTLDGRTLILHENGLDLQVKGPAITVFRDGVYLQEGLDYTFRYNRTSNEVVLTPLAGIWSEGVYAIRVNNRDQFIVDTRSGLDVQDGQTFQLTNDRGATGTFEFESGYTLRVAETLGMRVPLLGAAAGGVTDGQRFTISENSGRNAVTFEFDRNGNVQQGNRPIPFVVGASQNDLANAIVTALRSANQNVPGLPPAQQPRQLVTVLEARNLGGGLIHLGATADIELNVTQSTLTSTVAQFPESLLVPASGGANISDGESFTIKRWERQQSTRVIEVTDNAMTFQDGQYLEITDNQGTERRFEFDTNNSVVPGNIRIPIQITPPTSQSQIINLLVTEINNSPLNVTASVPGNDLTAIELLNATAVSRSDTNMGLSIRDPAFLNYRFEFDSNQVGGGVSAGSIRVRYNNSDTQDAVTNAIIQAMLNDPLAQPLRLEPFNSGNGVLKLGLSTDPNAQNAALDYSLIVEDAPRLGRAMFIGGVADGEVLTIDYTDSGLMKSVSFEFDSSQPADLSDATHVPIRFTPADTFEDLAEKLVDAITDAGLSLAPRHVGNGIMTIGGTPNHRISTWFSPSLTLSGAPGVQASTTLQLPTNIALQIPFSGGVGIRDGETFLLADGLMTDVPRANFRVFEFDSDNQLSSAQNARIPFFPTSTVDAVGNAIVTAIFTSGLVFSPRYAGNGVVELGAPAANEVTLPEDSSLTRADVLLLNANDDGRTFEVNSGSNIVVFEFEDASRGNGVNGANEPILFTPGASVDAVADTMVAVIRNAGLGIIPVNRGNGRVELNDSASFRVSVAGSPLTQSGVPGGGNAVIFRSDYSDDRVAASIVESINLANSSGRLTGVESTLRGGSTLFVRFDDQPGAVDYAAIRGIDNYYISAVKDLPGNDLKANQANDSTEFTIVLPGTQLDFGDAPDPFSGAGRYPSLFENNGARHVISQNPLYLGASVDADPDGQPSVNGAGDDADALVDVSNANLTVAALSPQTLQVPAAGSAAFTDGQTLVIQRGALAPITFEFDTAGNGVTTPNIPIALNVGDTPTIVAEKIVAAVRSQASLVLSAASLGGGVFSLGVTSLHTIDTSRSSLRTEGNPAHTLIVPAAVGSGLADVRDGEMVTFDDGRGSRTFEFDTDGVVVPGNLPVAFTTSQTPEQVASALIAAVTGSGLTFAGPMTGLTSQGSGAIYVRGPLSHTVNLSGTPLLPAGRLPLQVTVPDAGLLLTVTGTVFAGNTFVVNDGLNPAVTFEFTSTGGITPGNRAVLAGSLADIDQVSRALVTALKTAVTDGVLSGLDPVILGGGRVDLAALPTTTINTTGTANLVQSGVAGGLADGQTVVIRTGTSDVTFEFDRNNAIALGNRRVDISGGTGLGSVLAAALRVADLNLVVGDLGNGVLQLQGNDDDGVVFTGVLTPGRSTTVVVTSSGEGYLNAWIDWNQDGDWSDPAEQVFVDQWVVAGDNRLTVTVPAAFPAPSTLPLGQTYARFRLSSQSGLSPVGLAVDGEVEDHLVNVVVNNPPQLAISPAPPAGSCLIPDGTPGIPDCTVDEDAADQSLDLRLFFSDADLGDRLTFQVLNLLEVTGNGASVVDGSSVTITSLDSVETFEFDRDGLVAFQANPVTFNDHFTIQIPAAGLGAGGVIDGDLITITRGATDYVFEFDSNSVANVGIPIPVSPSATQDQLASAVVAAITAQATGLQPANLGGGLVILRFPNSAHQLAVTGNLVAGQQPLTQAELTDLLLQAINSEGQGITATLAAGVTPARIVLTGDREVGETLGNDGLRIVNQPNLVTVSLGVDGSTLTMDFQENENGVAEILVRATDRGGRSIDSSYVLTVTPVNDTPTASDHTFAPIPELTTNDYSLGIANPTSFSLLPFWNDGDPRPNEQQVPTFQIVDSSQVNGTITLAADFATTGNFTYRPNADFNTGAGRTATLTYRVADDATAGAPANLVSNVATITFQVTPVNGPPVGNNQTLPVSPAVALEDQAVTVTLTGTDGDPFADEVQSLTYSISTQPTSGTLTLLAPGQYRYQPNLNFNGTDQFQFTVFDGTLSSQPATVTIQIAPVNDAPSAANLSIALDEFSSYDSRVPGNQRLQGSDGDPEVDQVLTYAIMTPPTNGSLTFFDPATGDYVYTPTGNYNGPDSFTYRVTDDAAAGATAGLTSNTATVSITVQPTNQAPTATPQSVTIAEDTARIITLAGTDGDDGIVQVLTFAIAPVVAGVCGTFTTGTGLPTERGAISGFNLATGTLTYTPAFNYNGTDQFCFRVTDDASAGNPAGLVSPPAFVSITITPVNDAPVTLPVAPVTVTEDEPVIITLLGDDDGDGNPATSENQTLTYIPIDLPTKGTLAFLTGGQVQYTPDPNATGADSFTYVVRDDDTAGGPALTSSLATVQININAVNDPPVFTKGPNVTVSEDVGAQTIVGWATNVLPGPSTAVDELTQTVAFTVTVDQQIGSFAQLFQVPPAVAPDGTLSFTPVANANGEATVSLRLTDSAGASSPLQTFTIRINAVNDPPEFTLPSVLAAVNEDAGLVNFPNWATGLRTGPSGAVDETTGQQLTQFNISYTTSGNLEFTTPPTIDTTTGRLTFQTAPQTNGQATVRVSLSDNGSSTLPNVNTSAVRTFTISVNPVNDAPSFDAANVIVDEDADLVTIRGWASNILPGPEAATDESGQTLTFQASVVNPAGVSPILQFGTATVDPITGDLSFRTLPDRNGQASISVRLTDNGSPPASTPLRTFTVTVRPVNDAPQFAASNDTSQEDAGLTTVSGFVCLSTTSGCELRPGPATALDELNQTITFSAVNSNPALFTTQPFITANGSLQYQAAPNASGQATVTLTGTDNGTPAPASSSQTFTITVTPQNDPPSLTVPGALTVNEDTVLSIPSLSVSDVDAALLEVTLRVTNGRLTLRTNVANGVQAANVSNNGSAVVTVKASPMAIANTLAADDGLTYRGNLHFNGADQLTILVDDLGGEGAPGPLTATGSVNITVTPVNDTPFVANPIADVVVNEDDPPIVINLYPRVFNDADITTNADTLLLSVVSNSNTVLVNATIDPGANDLKLSFAPNASGEAEITVRATDRFGLFAEDTFRVTVTPVNDRPIAVNDSAGTARGQSVVIDVLANDSDIDGTLDPSSVTITNGPNNATALINQATGAITITPTVSFAGIVSFRYTVRDDLGALSNEATVTVAVAIPPVAVDDQATTLEGSPVDIVVLANDTDSDGTLDRSTVTITRNPNQGAVQVNATTGVVRYTPNAGFSGVDTFRYTVRDNTGIVSNEAIVTVTVTPIRYWQNQTNRYDANNDGRVTPLDALVIINRLNATGGAELPTPSGAIAPPPFYDVNGNGFIDPNDVLQVVNHLNNVIFRDGQGEGEGSWSELGTGIEQTIPTNSSELASAFTFLAGAGYQEWRVPRSELGTMQGEQVASDPVLSDWLRGSLISRGWDPVSMARPSDLELGSDVAALSIVPGGDENKLSTNSLAVEAVLDEIADDLVDSWHGDDPFGDAEWTDRGFI